MSYIEAELFNFLEEDEDMGDASFFSDLSKIPPDDRYSNRTKPFQSTGKKLIIPITKGRYFFVYDVTVEPTGHSAVSKNAYCFATVKFADRIIGRVHYDQKGEVKASSAAADSSAKFKSQNSSLYVHGDGTRELSVDVTSTDGEQPYEIQIHGYYAFTVHDDYSKTPYSIQNFTAQEIDPDNINLLMDMPLDNGGKPITSLKIERGETLDASTGEITDFTTLESSFVPPIGISESDVKYIDGPLNGKKELHDNTTYYYRVTPNNANGTGIISVVVSATTEIDHPSSVTNVAASKITPFSAKLVFETPAESGGVGIQGYHVQKRSKTKEGEFIDVITNTKSPATTFNVLGLTPDTWEFRVKAINDKGKPSLAWSDVAQAVLTYAAPSNIRYELSSDKKSVTVKWDPTSDVPSDVIHGYKIERSLDDITFATLFSSKDNPRTNYIDSTIDGGKVYFYKITALISDVLGFSSPTIKVIVPNRVASPPQNLNLTVLTHSKIKVAFDKPLDDGGLPRTGYELERSESIGFPDGTGGGTFEKKETPSPALPIHGQSVVTSNVTINDDQKIIVGHVQVSVDITHSWRGDVEIALVAPNGRSITLKTANLNDSANDVKATYLGDIFNDLIGIDSKGIWSLKIKDIFSEQDDGTLNSWTLKIEPALDSIVKIPLTENITEYIDNLPKDDTDYFYRIRAKTDVGDGEFSTTQNARTFKTIFGGGTDDLDVSAGNPITITSDKEYRNITIQDGATLYISNAIVKCKRYEEIGSGHIIVKQTGCPGGKKGITRAGSGGRSPAAGGIATIRYKWRRGQRVSYGTIPISNAPGTLATKTPAIPASACTDFTSSMRLLDPPFNIDMFVTKFKNNIKGGQGSDGTPAADSGRGGNGGNIKTLNSGNAGRSWFVGGAGGNGGRGADGVDGVRGGGKVALFFDTIVSTLRVIASGIDGINGIQGTGMLGTAGGKGSGTASNGGKGGDASTTGTLGSEGSQGGFVYVLYDNLEDSSVSKDTILNVIDVTGGLGGFNGGKNTGSHPLTTRAASGPEGLKLVSSLSDLS